MKPGETVFDVQARAGMTKHMGGMESTEALVRLCRIGPGSRVLDVGCGAGMTPCYLAEKIGCRVVAVDILPAMVDFTRGRVEERGLAELVEARVADVQELPFDDDSFDAVIGESVIVFPADKARAVGECLRVCKPGGYVGFTEATWLKTPVPPELVAWMQQDLSANASGLTEDEWVELLSGAGLAGVTSEIHILDARSASSNLLRRYGCREMLRIVGRTLRWLVTDPAYRAFVKEVRSKGGAIPPRAFEFFGYGNYVGRKPEGA